MYGWFTAKNEVKVVARRSRNSKNRKTFVQVLQAIQHSIPPAINVKVTKLEETHDIKSQENKGLEE